MMKKRTCDHEQCESDGIYRAPKGRHALRDYYWFCLKHVKEYNKRWNYFDGMSEEEIAIAYHARDRGLDETRDRLMFNTDMDDLLTDSAKREFAEMGVSSERYKAREGARHGMFLAQMMDREMEMCLRVLGLKKRDIAHELAEETTKNGDSTLLSRDMISSVMLGIVRKRYRQLAKVVHPDMQKGRATSKKSDDFQKINDAYTLLCRRLDRISLDD